MMSFGCGPLNVLVDRGEHLVEQGSNQSPWLQRTQAGPGQDGAISCSLQVWPRYQATPVLLPDSQEATTLREFGGQREFGEQDQRADSALCLGPT